MRGRQQPGDAFSTGNILQVLFVSILFGIALAMIGDLGKPVMTFRESVSAAFFKLVAILMKAASVGAAAPDPAAGPGDDLVLADD